MKRVQAACIQQTLRFFQKPEMGYSLEQARQLNWDELARYKAGLEQTQTRYCIVDETEQEDGSIVLRIKKQYNSTAEVAEYFSC